MAGTIPTKNPVPSKDVRDLGFNSEKMDEVINSEKNTYTDRMGRDHLTIKGLEEAAVSAGPTVEAAQRATEEANKARVSAENAASEAAKETLLGINSQVSIATEAADSAKQSEIAAELSAQSAQASGKLYTSLSDAEAAITAGAIKDNEYFYVVSSENNNFVDLYRNLSGVATFMNKSMPSSEYVESTAELVNELSNSNKVLQQMDSDNYVFGITDNEGTPALGIRESGQVDVNSLAIANNGATMSALSHDEYVYALTDKNGGMCFGVKTDGTVEIPKLDATDSSGSQHIFYIDGSKLQVIDANTGAIKVIDDGTIAIISSNDSVVYSKDSITFIAAPPEFKPKRLAPSLDIVCWGDSMTAGVGGESENISYPSVLAAELGVNVSKKGYGGKASTDIAVKQGGTQLDITYTGIIPSGSAVSVFVTPDESFRSVQTSYPGNISGNQILMTKSAAGEWTLKNEGSEPLEITGKAIFIGNEGKDEREKTAIFWVGRNNPFWNKSEPIFRDIAAMISYLNVSIKRSIVISLCNTSAEPKGSSRYNAMLDINSRLAQVYGDKFIDVRTYLITKGLSDAGIAPITQDVTDISNDIIPTSLRSDDTHLNAAGYALVGKYIAQQLKNKGWY
ncbi:hypothetical protein LHV18_20860 [Providencia rettgeri]|uniref:hypothetical protein n=2 Tax=Providencia TaxID=586 RepID=UPI001CFEC604|nr:hypothetical protein [Providencia rettgeri]EIU7558044.1 hypothetical protein [Providencia rettgeri]MCB4843066.1 hypothetical protein [Providencia rettgeri]MCG5276295.1 hypothetical protein [Providencia rettgeri]MCG9507153.1 hypothetical protein [Providencia rettgeri]